VSAVLAGCAALVTGASRGIGLATARALAAAGARLALLSRSAGLLHEIARELGGDAVALPCDIRDRSAVDRAVREVHDRLGRAPDILVNNAGAFPLAPVEDTSVDAFADALDVNLVAPFALVRAMLPAMRERASGHIVTVGSIADRTTFPGNAAYAAGKFGLRALHQVLREECRGSGIRTSLVSPGPVDTELWDPVDPDARKGFTPRARMLAPDAVAAAILYAVTQPPEVNVDELRLSRT